MWDRAALRRRDTKYKLTGTSHDTRSVLPHTPTLSGAIENIINQNNYAPLSLWPRFIGSWFIRFSDFKRFMVHGSWPMAISKPKVVRWFINTPFYEPISMNHSPLHGDERPGPTQPLNAIGPIPTPPPSKP